MRGGKQSIRAGGEMEELCHKITGNEKRNEAEERLGVYPQSALT